MQTLLLQLHAPAQRLGSVSGWDPTPVVQVLNFNGVENAPTSAGINMQSSAVASAALQACSPTPTTLFSWPLCFGQSATA